MSSVFSYGASQHDDDNYQMGEKVALGNTVLHTQHTIRFDKKLGSVAGPVIQANGRLTFEDDLRSGGLLCFTTQ